MNVKQIDQHMPGLLVLFTLADLIIGILSSRLNAAIYEAIAGVWYIGLLVVLYSCLRLLVSNKISIGVVVLAGILSVGYLVHTVTVYQTEILPVFSDISINYILFDAVSEIENALLVITFGIYIAYRIVKRKKMAGI